MARKHHRRHHRSTLKGLKEDALNVLAVGGGAVIGIAAAKFVSGKLEAMDFLKKEDKVTPADWAKWVVPLVPAAVGVGVLYGSAKANLSGAAKDAALGVAAGMAAVAIGKLVVAGIGEAKAKDFYLMGLGASVDSYDSGLLAGLGEYDASVARYMMAGAPTQVQSLMGAPLQVQSFAGAPTQVQNLAGAPMSATLM